ncbi:Veg family protein [Terrisporobacter petrolearius]|uniref:Veg family protein n=1 Tax=Terrisporobacter petrolearius TaxID=1460447 RepID=UPI003AFF8FB2
MATVQTLDNIRLNLEKHLGKKIILKANKGRKQITTKRGILENVYPSVFIVKLEASGSGYQRVSYSYSDLLTENVKLQVFKDSKKIEDDKLSVS